MSPRELSLAAAGGLVALASLVLSFGPPQREVFDREPAAVVFQTVGELKRRPAETLGWHRLFKGMGVFDADAVFVPPGGAGSLRFDDGTELFLDERSLVVVGQAPRGRQLTLRQGALWGRIGTKEVSLETPAGHASIAAQSELRVVLGPSTAELTMRRGSALVGAGHTLVTGQRAVAGSQGVELLPPWPMELIAPPAQSRRVFTGSPGTVELSWAGTLPRRARLQLAHDRLFAFVERDVAVQGTRLVIDRPTAGVTWWRLLDERGLPISESRRFVLVEDVPPVAMAPAYGEVVLAPTGTWVSFGWTARPDSERYRLEFAASELFQPVVLTRDVSQPTARFALGLPEGVWYWRVRSIDADEPGAVSKPSRFRLIHRAIPDAPVLLRPQVEVGE